MNFGLKTNQKDTQKNNIIKIIIRFKKHMKKKQSKSMLKKININITCKIIINENRSGKVLKPDHDFCNLKQIKKIIKKKENQKQIKPQIRNKSEKNHTR